MKKLVIFFYFLVCSSTSMSQTTPKSLLIYYGFPSKINSVGTLQAAADTFSRYRYVVWPDNMENAIINPTETPKNKQIFNLINSNTTKVFGYISLSMKTGGPKLSQNAIRAKIDLIYTFGVRGILFDECGYQDDVSRARVDSSVRYAHSKQMSIIANTIYPQEIFSNAYHATWNPNSMPTPFTNQDFYLFESYTIINGDYFRFQGENGSQYDEWEYWQAKSDSIRKYEQIVGYKTFSVTTPEYNSTYNAQKFHFAWFCAWLNGHEATGWGEQNFSSDVAGNTSRNIALFRNRPIIVNSGNKFISGFIKQGNNYLRYTNTGKIQVNTASKTYSFGNFDNITSVQTGLWNLSATWNPNAVPSTYDNVTLNPTHNITLSTGTAAYGVKINLKSNSKIIFQNNSTLNINAGSN
jgi:hypothetical protein